MWFSEFHVTTAKPLLHYRVFTGQNYGHISSPPHSFYTDGAIASTFVCKNLSMVYHSVLCISYADFS